MAKRNSVVAVLVSLLSAGIVYAHEGQPHIMGTVTAIDSNHIAVHTADGKSLSVLTDKNTTYRQGDKTAAVTDLKVGARVVLEVHNTGAGQTASEVRFAPTGEQAGMKGTAMGPGHQHGTHPEAHSGATKDRGQSHEHGEPGSAQGKDQE